MRKLTREEIDYINTTSQAQALIVQAEERRAREQVASARNELLAHLSGPGALEAHTMARIRANTPIVCDEDVPSRIAWAPAGVHRCLHKGRYVDDVYDAEGAHALSASLAKRQRDGIPAKIDFQHRDATSAGTVTAFSWVADVGIVADIEWTPMGRAVVAAGIFNYFSPTFASHPETRKVLGLAEGYEAGALCNSPSLTAMRPLLVSGESTLDRMTRETLIASGYSPATAFRASRAIIAGKPTSHVAEILRSMS